MGTTERSGLPNRDLLRKDGSEKRSVTLNRKASSASPATEPGAGPTTWSGRRKLALGIGGAVAVCTAVVYAALVVSETVPRGRVSLLLAMLVVIAAPTAELLTRRLMLNLSIPLGWLGVLWWLPDWFGALGRTQLVVGVAVGGLLGWVVYATIFDSRRLASLLPRMRWPDAPLLVVSTAVPAWLTYPLWSEGSPAMMMNRLVAGWDQAGHFSMIMVQRQLGALPPADPGIDGTPYFYAPYSQYLHSVINGVTELWADAHAHDPASELVLYGHSYSVVFIVLTTVLVAAVLQLPGLRRHPWLATLSGFLVIATMVLGPGGSAQLRGHLNVTFAAATLALILALIATFPDPFRPVIFLSLIGSVVAATGSWPLLGPFAAGAVLIGAVRMRGGLWSGIRRHLWSTIAISAVALTSAALTARIVVRPSGSDLTAPGDAVEAPLQMTIALMTICLLLAVWPVGGRASRLGIRPGGYAYRDRAACIGPTTLLFLAGLAVFAVIQFIAAGELTYYWWKLSLGLQIVLVVAIAIGMSRIAGSLSARVQQIAPTWRATGFVGALVAVTLLFGVVTSAPTSTYGRVSTAANLRQYLYDRDAGFVEASERVIAAARVAQHYPRGTVTYFAVLAYDGYSVLADHWMHAMLGDWTRLSDDTAFIGIHVGSPKFWEVFSYERVAKLVTRTLQYGGPNHVVVVAPEAHANLIPYLDAQFQDRVVTWAEQ